MIFNTDKCKVLHFGFNNPHTDYSMDGVKLQFVKGEQDLGVTVSADMKWERQCIETVKKANKMLGLIKRNFQDKSKCQCTRVQLDHTKNTAVKYGVHILAKILI